MVLMTDNISNTVKDFLTPLLPPVDKVHAPQGQILDPLLL